MPTAQSEAARRRHRADPGHRRRELYPPLPDPRL